MKLSIVIPCHNEEKNIEKLYELIKKELEKINFELIFINDGSSDKTFEKIKDLSKDNPIIKGISFSRNFGKEAAIYAGISHSSGDYTCILDADLQQHPKYVLEMVNYLDKNENIDQVIMINKNRKDSWLRKKLTKWFYRIINSSSSTNFIENASDFRTFRKNVKDSILQLNEVNRFSKGLFSWVGFESVCLPYNVSQRNSGKSSFTYKKLFSYAFDAIINYSVEPIKYITRFGLIISSGSFIYALGVIIKKIFVPTTLGGYSSTIVLILFFGGANILCIGLIGEYLSRNYFETKKRPIYLIKNKIGFDDDNIL